VNIKKLVATIVGGFVLLAAGLAFADEALTSPGPASTPTTDAPTTTTVAPSTTTTAETDAADEHDDHGPTRSTEGCPAGFTGNHGQFVSGTRTHDDDAADAAETPETENDAADNDAAEKAEHDDASEAAHSNCGKPEHDAAEHDAPHHDGDHDNRGPSATTDSTEHGGGGHGHDSSHGND
jgi:hypothetical protein